MANNPHETATYKMIPDTEGNRFRFYCDISGAAVCTTGPVRAGNAEEERMIAWELDGKKHFHLCLKCGRWVSDSMYNADVCECVDCTPWEEVPNYCPHCGEKVPAPDIYCRKCGGRLRYGEVWT